MRKYSKSILTDSGHTFKVESIDKSEMPELDAVEDYMKFYKVTTIKYSDGDNKNIIFYLGKGYIDDLKSNEVVGWYAKMEMFWASYGNNIEEAVEGLIKDYWLYDENKRAS